MATLTTVPVPCPACDEQVEATVTAQGVRRKLAPGGVFESVLDLSVDARPLYDHAIATGCRW